MLDMMDSGVSAIPFTDRIAHAAVERREAVMVTATTAAVAMESRLLRGYGRSR